MTAIAVLGGGHGGWAAAGHLSVDGHEVRLWGRDPVKLAPLVPDDRGLGSAGRMIVRDAAGEDVADVAVVTDRLDTAVAGARLILVVLPAYAQLDVCTNVASLLTGDQTVVFLPGNFVGPFAARAFQRRPVLLAETAGLPYGARRVAPDAVHIVARSSENRVAAFPAARTREAVEVLGEAYPEVRGGVDSLDVALLNIGPVMHPALLVCNTAPLERGGRYDLHVDGTTTSVRRIIDRIDAERIAVRQGLGYPEPHYPIAEYYDAAKLGQGMWGGAGARVHASDLWSEPVPIDGRYMREDAAYGLALLTEAGRLAGVPTPAADAVLELASIIHGEELSRPGRGLAAARLDVGRAGA